MDERYSQAADYLKSKIPFQPEVGIILGSGLGGLADRIEDPIAVPYHEVPHMAVSTAPGHKGRFIAGRIAGVPVICMQGRLHCYEGYPMRDVVFPVRAMRLLGVETLIVTNAAGGINLDFTAGDLMLITDHINFLGENPLVGTNEAGFGPRFNDMSYTYTKRLQELALQAAKKTGIDLKQGVYIACKGPSYETPAEIRAFRALGADAVGMSTVPEVITAAHCGMRVLAISLISNMAAGVLDQPLDEQEVIDAGERKAKDLQKLVSAVIARLGGATDV